MRRNLIILNVITSLLLGYFFRDALTPSEEGPVQNFDATESFSTRTRMISIHRRALERTMRISESTQRWLSVVALLEKATIHEMQGIAESVGSEDERVTKLIAQRWFELDPQHFFETSLLEIEGHSSGRSEGFSCSYFMKFLAEKWPQHNFQAAFRAFSRPDPKRSLNESKSVFVNHWVKVDVDKAIELHRAWNTRFRSDGRGYLRASAEEDPRAIAQIIFSHYDSISRKREVDRFSYPFLDEGGGGLIEIVAKVWGEVDPAEAVAFAQSYKNDQGAFLLDKVVSAWVMSDEPAAARWLDLQSAELQKRYRPSRRE